MFFEPVEPRLLLTTYYVSPAGSDSFAGTSAAAPFQTIAKVNSLDLNAGDKVLFQGSQTFAPPAATNQVTDPGFESGTFANWPEVYDELAGTTVVTSTPSEVHSGTYALRANGVGGRGQDVTSRLKPSVAYLVSFWGKTTSNGTTAFAGITAYLAGVEVRLKSFSVTSTTYQKYSGIFIAPASFDFADVWTKKTQGPGALLIDDFSITETNTLVFDANDAGSAAAPVTIGSYGAGKATIQSGDFDGVYASNVSYFGIENLKFTGNWDALNGTGGSNGSGVIFENVLPAPATRLNSIRAENLEASGYKWTGIAVRTAPNRKAGFDGVTITNCLAHDNGDAGINVGGFFDALSTAYAHANVTVSWCKSYNNYGLSGIGSHSGNGILIGDVDGGTIERCIAWNNGQRCDYSGGGPIGIWAWDANNVTIQYNESYANKTGSASVDGGGFDFDGGVTNSRIQYNYSHDNAGAGYLFWQFSGARTFGNNTVRYNISQNDGRKHAYAGFLIGGGAAIANNLFYGNTIYVSPAPDAGATGIKIAGVGVNNRFVNNIVYATSGLKLLDSDAAYAATSVLFQNNVWYATGGAFSIKWGATTHTSLSDWRATGQEMDGANAVGTSNTPNFVSAGGGGTIGDAAKLHLMTAYQLLPGSSAIDAGRDLSSLGISFGSRDYFGQAPNYNGAFDVGAFEWRNRAVGGSGADAFLIRAGSGGTTEVFVNNATTIPTYTFANSVYPSYVIDAGAGVDVVDYHAPLISTNFFGTQVFNLNAGSYTFGPAFGSASDLTVNVATGTTANFTSLRPLTALSVAGTLNLTGTGMVTKSLTVSGAGRLNVDTNFLIVDYASASRLDDVSDDIASARNGEAWDGPGITSAAAPAAGGITTLGVAEAADALGIGPGQTALFNGVTVDATAVLVKYTYGGDANLDGFVTGDDYSAIDFGILVPGAAGWLNGDFNYDGAVTGDDYAAIDFNILIQGTPL
jgi:hypothetical protein